LYRNIFLYARYSLTGSLPFPIIYNATDSLHRKNIAASANPEKTVFLLILSPFSFVALKAIDLQNKNDIHSQS
jgi:hypothetical protein